MTNPFPTYKGLLEAAFPGSIAFLLCVAPVPSCWYLAYMSGLPDFYLLGVLVAPVQWVFIMATGNAYVRSK